MEQPDGRNRDSTQNLSGGRHCRIRFRIDILPYRGITHRLTGFLGCSPAEAKFKHDQEFQFKTNARPNKLLGLWAAEQMGISGADAEAYAKQAVIDDFEEPGDADVLRKVLGNLTDKGIATDEHKVR